MTFSHVHGHKHQRRPLTARPPRLSIRAAIEQAHRSMCHNQQGAALWHYTRDTSVVIAGHNHRPRGSDRDCKIKSTCESTCLIASIHAMQDALFHAGTNARGADMLHVRVRDGLLEPVAPPSCLPCGKMILDSGIVHVWLYHRHGWRRYTAHEFHARSLDVSGLVTKPHAHPIGSCCM